MFRTSLRACYTLSMLTLLVAAGGTPANAQREEEEPLNLEWVRKDVGGVGVLLRLMPVEGQNIDALKKAPGKGWGVEDDTLGFGANRVRFRKGYGYSSVFVDVFTFKGEVAYYEIGVDGSLTKWPAYRDQIIAEWRQNGGPEFVEGESGLSYKRRFDGVFASYHRAVAGALGEMKPVDVPSELKELYEYLTSPMNNSYVGSGGCGYGGTTLEGKVSTDALVEAKRIDLLENVLRGYNPGGRVYAAIALTRMEKRGVALSPETRETLQKVLSLDVPVSTCSGCIVTGGLRAKDVVRMFTKERDVSP